MAKHDPPISDNASVNALNDEQLASRAQAGSMPSLVELVSRFEGRVYNFVLRRVNNAADAEDLTQETFLRAWRSIARYRTSHRFSTWLFTIASRLAVDHLRSKRTAKHKMNELARQCCEQHDDATRSAGSGDAGAALWQLAATVLSDEQHAALWLRYAEDLSIKEVARVLRRTQISVRVMLFRARDVLSSHAVEVSGLETRLPAARKDVKEGVPCSC